MSTQQHLHIYLEPEHGLATRLDLALAAINSLHEKVDQMSQNLDSLKAAVAANTAVIGSAVALIGGLAEKLQTAIDAGADPAELQALADELRAQDTALAEAVAANTPADPALASEPEPAPDTVVGDEEPTV